MDQKVLATAAGQTITEEDVTLFIQRLPKEQQMYAQNPQFRQQVISQMVGMILFTKLGEEEKLDETEEFQKTMNDVRKDLLSQMAVTDLMKDITVTEEEKKEYFKNNQAQFNKGAQAKAKHILTPTEEEAQKAKEEVASGTKTFAEAATAYSTCPSKERGGDLGSFGKGQMVPEFEKAVFEAEIGSLIGPVKTQFGYHIIQVDELSEETAMSYEEIQDRIGETLLRGKQNAVYQKKYEELSAKYGAELK